MGSYQVFHHGCAMVSSLRAISFSLAFLCFSFASFAPPAAAQDSARNSDVNLASQFRNYGSIAVTVMATGGKTVEGSPQVALINVAGQFIDQKAASHGFAQFDVPAGEYKVQVIAPKYEIGTKTVNVTESASVKVTVELSPFSDAEDAASSERFYALQPKVQRDVGKALQALRVNKPTDALHPLESAQKAAPKSAEVEYLLGVYSSQLKNESDARAHWMKALELNPQHLSALLSIGHDLLDENKPAEALPFLNRAVEAEPFSWRAHALLAHALVLQQQNDEAIKEAQRAIDLGHERADSVQLILVRALAVSGQRDQAIKTLEAYVKAHPSDAAAAKDLDTLKSQGASSVTVNAAALSDMNAADANATALPIASNWMPPDVDEKIPSVDAAASCSVNDVVQKAGQRLMDLISDVDRFSATESLTHESINKYGVATNPEKRKFDYVVSIQDFHHTYLNVEEYRNGTGGSAADFPDGVATNGLPALVLIFHPYNAVNFEMTCEGLSRISNGLAWQVHFRQRADKPNTIRKYRMGVDGPAYSVALKGRAWISSDTYQIVRLESNLVSPIPQIRLVAEHTAIEYGPVKFGDGKVNMWLPQSADIYYDWKGRRVHRRHSFSHYLLFGVEERQKISVPKVDESLADSGPHETNEKPQP
jgi:tetratricopeptide (TPR) repeat protein